MDARDENAVPDESQWAEPVQPVGQPAIAWIVIILVTALMAVFVMLGDTEPDEERGKDLGRTFFQFQARYFVGSEQLLGAGTEPFYEQLEQSAPETEWYQVRLAVLAGELEGPDAAVEQLHEIKKQRSAEDGAQSQDAAEQVPLDTLIELYEGYQEDQPAAAALDEAQRERLGEQLGWFGKLALAPPGEESALRAEVLEEARRTVFTVLAAVVLFGLLALLGVFLLIVFLALLFTGNLQRFDAAGRYGGVYAEAFAAWLVLFVALSFVTSVLFPPEAIGALGLPALGSLLALAWPLLRGVSWRQVREDIGWTKGDNTAIEVLAGIGGYAMLIPLILMALLLIVVIAGLVSAGAEGDGSDFGSAPTHPAAELLITADWWQRLQILILGCIIAPIVEETVFRGLFYRHLREATVGLRRWASVLLSAIISGIFFALIHPQGLLGVPAIASIALGLALVREWRGTLLPAMIAHALNNGVVMLLIIWLLAG